MSKTFRKFRGVPDKVLVGAIQQHSGAITYALNRVQAYDRFRWVRRAWYLAVTAQLAWLAHQTDIRAVLHLIGVY
jgi:hypothetical protein